MATNPRTSLRKLASALGLKPTTARLAVHDLIGLRCYKQASN